MEKDGARNREDPVVKEPICCDGVLAGVRMCRASRETRWPAPGENRNRRTAGRRQSTIILGAQMLTALSQLRRQGRSAQAPGTSKGGHRNGGEGGQEYITARAGQSDRGEGQGREMSVHCSFSRNRWSVTSLGRKHAFPFHRWYIHRVKNRDLVSLVLRRFFAGEIL